MKKILFVDSWCIGLRITTPLVKELNKEFECYFLHFDNLQSKSGKSVKQTIENFDKTQYSPFYSKIFSFNDFNNSATELIQDINPDLLIFISLHGFEQKYINEIASQFNKPSILVMHGVRSYNFKGIKSFIIKKIITRFPRIIHFTRLYIYYLKDLKRNQIKRTFLDKVKRYYLITIKHSNFLFNPGKDFGCNYDILFTTHQKDRDYFIKNYGIKNSTNFKVIGHIDNHKLIKEITENKRIKQEENLLFISQPLVSEGLLDYNEFKNVINSVNKISKELNLKFKLRAHPSDDKILLNDLKSEFEFELTENSLEVDIIEAKLIVGFFSTALFTAQIIDKPMIIYNLENLPYLDVILSYHNSIIFNKSINDLNQSIERIKKLNFNSTELNVEKLKKSDPIHIIKSEICKLIC